MDLTIPVTALTVAAGLALATERCLEILKHLLARAPVASLRDRLQRAESLSEEALETAKAPTAQEQDPDPAAQTNTQNEDTEPEERHLHDEFISGTAAPLSVTAASKRLFLQLAGAGLGVVFAQTTGLQLFNIVLGQLGAGAIPALADTLMTGLVIGGGSQPLHLLIRLLEKRDPRPAPLADSDRKSGEPPSPPSTAMPTRTGDRSKTLQQASSVNWSPVVYSGGVDVQKLEGRNHRPGNPDLVVYHHTAMHSSTSFADIVREFTEVKGWSTGYHCVVMPDGKLEHFCRWDRIGNHARGRNSRSLGIAFHGNFHTLAGDAYSNEDGRFGPRAPSEAQLVSGARLIAIWARLYPDINGPDFENGILPHRDIIKGHTVCPGSNFPHRELREQIRFFYDMLESSEEAARNLRELARGEFVFAKGKEVLL